MAFITVALIIIVGLPIFFFIYQLDKIYQNFTVNMMETTAQMVYQYIFDGMMENDKAFIQREIQALAREPSIEGIRIFRPDGTILFSSNPWERNKLISSIPNEEDLRVLGSKGKFESFVRYGDIYSHRHPISIQKECTLCHQPRGKIIAILDVQTQLSQSEQLYLTAKKLAIFSAGFIIIFLWITFNFLYQHQIERRLLKFIDAFNRVAGGNLNIKLNIPGRHELATLASKFNEMVSRLKTARQKEEQFFIEKLERADRLVTLGEVAAEIAHEVNNPASIILSRAEILRDELQEKGLSQNFEEDMDIIIQQIEKIAATTKNILYYARTLPQTFSEIELNNIIVKSIKVMELRIRQRKVSVELDLHQSPILLKANPIQLEQVFCNLLNNSLDAVQEKKGKIFIRTVLNQNGYCQIHFEDNGPGIPPEHVDKIFSPFFTTKSVEQGTGLGLFIVRNIIENHGGKIYVNPRPRKGAHFVIELEVQNAKN